MSVYKTFAETTLGMIQRFGRALSIEFNEPGTYDPATSSQTDSSTSLFPHTGLEKRIDFRRVDGKNVLANDREVLLPAKGLPRAPQLRDRIVIADVAYSVAEVVPLSPGGEDVAYTVRIRR